MKPCPKPSRRIKTLKELKDQLGRQTRTVKAANPLEEDEQHVVAHWLDAHGVLYQASAMGSFMHPATYMKAKKLGCKAGFPDLMVYDRPVMVENGKLYVGAAIEMKIRKGGIVSDEQTVWMMRLEERGWKCKIARGCDEAIAFLIECGYDQPRG